MHVTHGAVSRQIRLLEEALGVELFERRNRAVFLTAAGRTLHLTTTVIFEQLEATVHRLRQQANEDILVVSCEPTIAMKWLIPRLPAFQLAHPDIQLHLSAAGGPIDFAKAGVDVALRRDDFRWATTLHATRICDEWMGPVTAPRNQSPSSNLDCARLLHTASRPTAWNTWLRLSNVSARDSTQGNYEHFYLCIRAAVAGLGTAMASYFMVQEELVGGQLVAPFRLPKRSIILLFTDVAAAFRQYERQTIC